MGRFCLCLRGQILMKPELTLYCTASFSLSLARSRTRSLSATTLARLVLRGTNAALNTHMRTHTYKHAHKLSNLLTAATPNQQTHMSLLLMEHNCEMTDGGEVKREVTF